MPELTTAETADTTTSETEPRTPEASEKLTPPPELQAVIDKERQSAKDAEKARKVLEKELNELRAQSMSESEKAVADARAAGRTEAASEFGRRLARTEFDAIAGRRNPDFDTASALEWVDLARFVGEDGEPDTKAITAAVERLVPVPANGAPSFDGGARTPPPAFTGMDALIRKAAGRA